MARKLLIGELLINEGLITKAQLIKVLDLKKEQKLYAPFIILDGSELIGKRDLKGPDFPVVGVITSNAKISEIGIIDEVIVVFRTECQGRGRPMAGQ